MSMSRYEITQFYIKRAEAAALVELPGGASPESPEVAEVETQVPLPTASEGVHPLAVSPEEGMFAVPQEKVVKKLQALLRLKYTAVIMWMNYGDRVRAHFRDAIYDHFNVHLLEERDAAYDLAMKITALGGEPTPAVSRVPDIGDLHQIFITLLQAEKELIVCGRELLLLCGENTGLRVLIENTVLVDQKHADDLRRMFLCEK